MKVLKIKVNATVSKREKGDGYLLDGLIYFSFGNYYFPEKNWYDFVTRLLNMWGNELVNALEKNYTKATLFFMDGPFSVNLNKTQKPDIWQMECAERGLEKTVILHKNYISMIDLLKEIKLSSEQIKKRLIKQTHSEIDSLKVTIEAINKYLSQKD